MIQIDFSLAIALYLLVTLVAIACAWLMFENKLKTKGIFKNLYKKRVWQCSVCTHAYIDKESDLSVCPQCKSYNRKEIES